MARFRPALRLCIAARPLTKNSEPARHKVATVLPTHRPVSLLRRTITWGRLRLLGCRTTRSTMSVAQLATSAATPAKDLYEIGEIPPLGHVPARMYAWVIRKERHGPPETSMQIEVVPTWPIGEDDVLVHVMAGGVNYNGVWGGPGQPISPHEVSKNPLHIARP